MTREVWVVDLVVADGRILENAVFHAVFEGHLYSLDGPIAQKELNRNSRMVINPGRGLLSVRVTLNLWIDVELDEGVRLPSGVLARCVSRVLTFILGCCVWRVIKTRNRVGNDPIVGNVVAAGTADVGRELSLSVGEGDLV